ncbi:hypothetical protein CEY12_02585 [Chryseobacterium sp. T16E-39]|uniref:hypothetical protein n=1 Tax=Chryseobacterium sp. T16E-39 TaxID=2015076 RepID=UPI000B5B2ABD|nr:hypothetical protein [Chryseobacterium sp. T16E-39]ASK29058.1 hypothetical protein CEY12_02585 [Chryseobacterium sp. T16E-39]
MKDYKYFIQEGSRFHLKTKMSTAVLRVIACLIIGIALYCLIPAEKKIGLWAALLFVFFALVNLLKTTKRLVIDTQAKTITHKNNILSGEVVYRFEDFIQFYVLVGKYLFITMDSTAFFIFDQNGKEKRVPIIVGLFGSKTVQAAINEISEIMNIEER